MSGFREKLFVNKVVYIIILVLFLVFGVEGVLCRGVSNRSKENLDLLVYINYLVEENNTIYNIRNEILYRNSNIYFDRANYKSIVIYTYCRRYDIDPYLLLAIGIQESNLSHYDGQGEVVVSQAGAKGVFQIMAENEESFSLDAEIFEENVLLSVLILEELFKIYTDSSEYTSLELILAHYNGGSNPEYAIKYYSETREYVPAVLDIYRQIKKVYK